MDADHPPAPDDGWALKRALIVGASGGIGSALARELSARRPRAEIWGTFCRGRPEEAVSVSRWWQLDLRDPARIHAAAARVREACTARGGLDALIVAAGWLHDEGRRPEKSVRELDAAAFSQAMAVNATGPLLLVSALREALTAEPSARIMLLSAKVGSIADNRLGGWYAYRMSKAALNMGVRCLGIELSRGRHGPLVSAVHPGTTATPLSAPFSKRGLRVVPPAQTAARLADFLEAMSHVHQGGFFHWNGSPLPG